jgi:hypothetical protein
MTFRLGASGRHHARPFAGTGTVALDEESKEIYFGEAKWSMKPVGVDVLDELKRKAALVDWNLGDRKERFMLFSKSGFTEAILKAASKEGVILSKRRGGFARAER